MSDAALLLLAVYLLVMLALVPAGDWPELEEWAALLWPLVAVGLLVIVAIALPLLAAEKARGWMKARSA